MDSNINTPQFNRQSMMLDAAVIKECMLKHPEAENEIVAVDLEAQAEYKAMQLVFGKKPQKEVQIMISRYNYLRDLRDHLNEVHIEKLSSFIIKN